MNLEKNIISAQDQSVDYGDSSKISAGLFSFTLVQVLAYCSVFLIVFIQLWLILYYRYKKFSFQSVFLFLCLFWSGLRAVLFSTFFKDCTCYSTKYWVVYWILYGLPVCIQFFILCLLSIYYVQETFKTLPQFAADPQTYNYPPRFVCGFFMLAFMGVNIMCSYKNHFELFSNPDESFKHVGQLKNTTHIYLFTRIYVNGAFFILIAFCLALCLIMIARSNSARVSLRLRGISVCKSVVVGVIIVLLFVSRSFYNVFAVSSFSSGFNVTTFDMEWYLVTDQAEGMPLDKGNQWYFTFSCALLFWEFLPTTLTLVVFNVFKRCSNGCLQRSLISVVTVLRLPIKSTSPRSVLNSNQSSPHHRSYSVFSDNSDDCYSHIVDSPGDVVFAPSSEHVQPYW